MGMTPADVLVQVAMERHRAVLDGRALYARFHGMTKEEWDAANARLAARFRGGFEAEDAALTELLGCPPARGGFEIPIKCAVCKAIQPIGVKQAWGQPPFVCASCTPAGAP